MSAAPTSGASAGPAEPAAPEAAWSPPALSTLEPIEAQARALAGHAGGRYVGRALASRASDYRDTSAPAPGGLVVCVEQRDADTRDEGPTLCMRRGREGWSFGVLLPGQTEWARLGALSECAACHSAAPRGGLFGP